MLINEIPFIFEPVEVNSVLWEQVADRMILLPLKPIFKMYYPEWLMDTNVRLARN